MPRFSLKNMFAGILVFAVLFAFLAREPIGVAFAALFCFLSCLGLSYLIFRTIEDLYGTISLAFRLKTVSILSRRIRWIFVDGLIVVWGLITISIANFVHQNTISNGRYFVLASWVVGPLLIAAILARRRGILGARKS